MTSEREHAAETEGSRKFKETTCWRGSCFNLTGPDGMRRVFRGRVPLRCGRGGLGRWRSAGAPRGTRCRS